MYSRTNWEEHLMSESDKLTALTNAETIYDEGISYIDSLTHSTRYYTKAECDAKYIQASTDGSGSGVVCMTLGGLTAQQIIDAGIPSGIIAFWPSSEASIPAGWHLCTGGSGTPLLTNRFIVGAGGAYTKGDTGGANYAYPTASAVSIGTHAITSDELPAHTHTLTEYYRSSLSGAYATGCVDAADHTLSTNAATSTAHGHSGSSFTGIATDVRPAFRAVLMICKD